ncbi:MAG: hypothetical protein RLZZ230_715 [Candidatus Parcubacteria bacterium]|jgi:DNA-binding response OmpR family regulator
MPQKTILIVEDSPYLAESLFDMFSLKGHKPMIAPTGREAVDLALNFKPDLILLDIRLPDIDGYEVFRRIRADDWGASVKIIVLTASESIDVISKNINLPKDYILFKPDWSVQDLIEKIESHLNS